MSFFFTDQPRSSKRIRPPHIKPHTTPKGTRGSTIPHLPVAPQGGHGPPSGGIGINLNPPKTRGGTPIPGLTYVHRVPGENRRFPFTPMFGDRDFQGRDDRFPRGDGRDRGPIPHPLQLRTDRDRWFKHLKAQRGEGHFADFFRSRIGFGDIHECNKGQHFEDGHHEFTLCDERRRFLANGIGWTLEEAIDHARRFGRHHGNIFDFDRNQFVPPNQFLANPSVLGSNFPVASPFNQSSFPPVMQPTPGFPSPVAPITTPNLPSPPFDVDTTGALPDTTVMDDGTGTDTGSSGTNMQADMQDASSDTGDGSGADQQPTPPQGAGGAGGSTILDKIKGNLPVVLLIGAGLVLLLIVKK